LTKIFFIADFFYKDLTGGAELNDYSVIARLRDAGFEVVELYCKSLTIDFLNKNSNDKFIIANFVTMPEYIREHMAQNCKYIIYEHDHKYLKRRNPIFYKDFIAPKEELANVRFYKRAKKVVCLTQLAVDVIKANTGLANISKIGASVWTDADLEYIKQLSKNNRNGKYAIMDSDNPIKKREQCIKYCEKNNIEYELIKDKDHKRFLEKLSYYTGLVFMTGHLETCCRLVVEAKMMNCKVIMQHKLIGATSEDWFSFSGRKLTEEIREVSKGSVRIFEESFGE